MYKTKINNQKQIQNKKFDNTLFGDLELKISFRLTKQYKQK